MSGTNPPQVTRWRVESDIRASFGGGVGKEDSRADEDGHHIGDFSRRKEHDAYPVAFERRLRDLKLGDS